MDYKEKYEEALERAKKLMNKEGLAVGSFPHRDTVEQIFPELRESEYEKIRKELYRYFRDLQLSSDREFSPSISIDEILSWLEKHKEQDKCPEYCVRSNCMGCSVYEKQKPAEPDTEIRDIWEYIREWADKFGRFPKDEDELAACIDYVMKRQKPVEWSKEDEKKIMWLVRQISTAGYRELDNDMMPCSRMELLDWLKSLKPNHWKPSEENIKDLEWCADLVKDKMGVGFHRLQVFIDELKKL